VPSHWFGVIELLLVFGLVLGWAGWQWWDWRRWRRQQQELQDGQREQPDADRDG
jgi:hypothetical protein